jgi:spermidine synthase
MRLVFGAAAFFLSGFAALTYQVVWQRLLVLPMGADVYSTTVVVAVFMAGLGCGSLAGGRLADRLPARRSIDLFIAAELAVGVFGLFSDVILYDWMYGTLAGLAMPRAALAAIAFAALLWPTFWMGMSLPLLGRGVTDAVHGAARRVGLLYGLNTLGAAAGACATTWILFPRLGLDGAVSVAAALNVIAAATALALRRGAPVTAAAAAPPPPVSAGAAPAAWPFAAWAALYAIAGFQALSLEIVWFRLLGVMVKSSAFTFGTLLTVYLAGLGLGAAAGSAMVNRIQRPGRAFLLLQAAVGLYAGASVLLLVWLLPRSPALAGLWTYLGSYEPLDAAGAFSAFWSGERHPDQGRFAGLYVLLPLALVGPPTLAMGASFPLVQKLAIVDMARLGRRVSAVLAANIGGSTAGAILTGSLALTHLSSAGTLRLMTAIGGVFLACAIPAGVRGHVVLRALAGAGAVAVTARLPDARQLWAAMHGTTPPRMVSAEDATGLAIVKSAPPRAVVYVNGIGQSWIPYGGIHTILGALPAFVHPDPRTAVVIGLGSGDTAYAVAGRPELTRVTCVEIIRPQLATLQAWTARAPYPALGALLSDPRIAHVAGDGRAYVMRSAERYDIIEADALRPASAYSGHFYSAGYFRELRDHLAPGGLAVTWGPTPRVHDTFASVFPHVLSFGDILIGSARPIPFDGAAIRARVAAPAARDYFWRAGVDIQTLLAPYLDRPPARIDGGATRADLNEDLFPRDEFNLPRTRQP